PGALPPQGPERSRVLELPVSRRALRWRRRRAARLRPEPAAVPRSPDRRRRRELRLRLLARGRGVGSGGLRHALGDRAEPRRHLPSELLQERLAAGDPAGRRRRAAPAPTP